MNQQKPQPDSKSHDKAFVSSFYTKAQRLSEMKERVQSLVLSYQRNLVLISSTLLGVIAVIGEPCDHNSYLYVATLTLLLSNILLGLSCIYVGIMQARRLCKDFEVKIQSALDNGFFEREVIPTKYDKHQNTLEVLSLLSFVASLGALLWLAFS